MLARNGNPTNTSPFYFKGAGNEKQQTENKPAPKVAENNRERTFRRAGNACEIIAGASLNSTVIFTFHLLQVNPVGLFLAVGTAHFYLTATAIGEKSFPVAMVGGAASLSCLCALSEPVGEWWEAKTSIESANTEIQRLQYQSGGLPGWSTGVILAIALLGVRILIPRSFVKR
jgi:hypothetical protein